MVPRERKSRTFRDILEELDIECDEGLFTTGVVCRLLDIPVWVLKQLDEEGLVSPPRKKKGQARLYSVEELSMVQHCWFYMREHGVKVNGLRIILKMEGRDDG